ncbi:MAG: hypothetical protein AB1668_06645 [Nanoarchaeota archaeon]
MCLSFLVLILFGCAEQISDEELEKEMRNMSDKELGVVIKQTESGEKPMAGQAIAKVPSDKAAKIAYKIMYEREKSAFEEFNKKYLEGELLPSLGKARPECGNKICEKNKGESFSGCPLGCPQEEK